MIHRLSRVCRSLVPAHLRHRFGAERGAVMVLAAVALVGVMASTAIAVDIGHATDFKKDLQGDADLAALDAIRALSDRKGEGGLSLQVHTEKLAKESLKRNEFDTADPGNTWSVVLGNISNLNSSRVFVPAANLSTANAVKVTLTGPIDWSFQPGGRTFTAEGIAEAPVGPPDCLGPGCDPPPCVGEGCGPPPCVGPSCPPCVGPSCDPPPQRAAVAGFSLGSYIARLDTGTAKSKVLNHVLGGFLGGNLNLDLVSYQGLAAGEVTLRRLATALDLEAGTPDAVLGEQLTMLEFLQAAAEVMTTDGNTAAAQAALAGLVNLATSVNSNAQFQLGELITVAQGGESAALDTGINLFQLVSGSAQVADGDHFINIPMVGVTIPGLSSLTLKLQVIEAPQIAIGPARIATDGKGITRVKTAQIRAMINMDLINVSLLGVTARLKLPIYIEGGGAKADLRTMGCGPLRTATVGTTSQALYARVAEVGETDMKDISTSTTVISPVEMLNLIGVVRVTGSSTPYTSTQTSNVLSFQAPYPQTQTNGGSTTLGLSTILRNGLTLNTQVLGLGVLINPLLGGLTATLTSALSSAFGALDAELIDPLLSSLGLSLGGADVTVFRHHCISRRLVK